MKAFLYITIISIYILGFYATKVEAFESKYFNFKLHDNSTLKKKKQETIHIKEKHQHQIDFSKEKGNLFLEKEIKLYLKELKYLNFTYQQMIIDEGKISSGEGEFEIEKPHKIVYKYRGTSNDNNHYQLIKDKDVSVLLDEKTKQKTFLDRKGGIEEIFLKNNNEIDILILETAQFADNKILSCFTGLEEEKFCLVFERMTFKKEIEKEKIETETTEQIQDAILESNKTYLNLLGIVVHQKAIHSELKINKLQTKKDNSNKEDNIIQDSKLQDE